LEQLGERCLLSGDFVQTNLISDVAGLAQFTDANLINPWGVAAGPNDSFWFSDNSSGVATSNQQPSPVIAIPGVAGVGSPTGAVFNPTAAFTIATGKAGGPSQFLFATEDGLIEGWIPSVNGGEAVIAVDNSSLLGNGPIYTGLTMADSAQGPHLFAANFRTGAIDVFDQEFHQIGLPGAFTDPNLAAGYVPFNVQAIGSSVYVTYILQNGGQYDRSPGLGNGVVDVYDTLGHFGARLITQGPLNAPWGVAIAPGNFGPFANALLVGNFGDGHINAFDSSTGAFLGTLTDGSGAQVDIPDLWSLRFEPGVDGAVSALYFTAGVDQEHHGLFGSLQPSGPGVAPNNDFLQQQTLLHAIDNGLESSDDYPVIPAQGPALRQTTQTPAQSPIGSISLRESPLAIAPAITSMPPGAASITFVASTPTASLTQTVAGQNSAPLLTAASTFVVETNSHSAAPGLSGTEQATPLSGQAVMANLFAQVSWEGRQTMQQGLFIRTLATPAPTPATENANGADQFTAPANSVARDEAQLPPNVQVASAQRAGIFAAWFSNALALVFVGICWVRFVAGGDDSRGARALITIKRAWSQIRARVGSSKPIASARSTANVPAQDDLTPNTLNASYAK
jgi:uncharacterized protein (TIGR03118 family)